MDHLTELKARHLRLVAKARGSTIEYQDGLQALLDAGDLIREIERLRAALTKIAAYDDRHGSERLAATGSYGGFDEPGSVELARRALEQYERKL